MILKIIKKHLNTLRLTTQILSIQAISIGLIFVIVMVICFYQISRFQQYMKAELLESVIQKSIISNIQLLVGESMHLSYIIYTSYGDELALLIKLDQFQRKNKIKMDGFLEECEGAVQIRSYQQCYNGSETENIDNYQIKQLIQFQNYILPYKQDHQQILGYLNMQLGDQLTYSIQVQEQKPKFDENLEKIYVQFKTLNNSFAISQIANGTNSQVYVFYAVPQTKIALGMLTYYEQKPILIEIFQGLQARTYIVLESGFILTDTQFEFQGKYLQNISGFTNLQFEMIKNFTLRIPVPNQCEKQLQGKTLCLIDNQNNQKLIFSYVYKTDYVQYIINILDGNFVGKIRQDFDQQFNNFVNTQIKLIVIFLFAILVFCLAIQGLLIINLSRPLQQLVEIAQYNFNHNQYKFQSFIRTKHRNQIRKLQDAYFDLINLSKQNKNNHVKQYYDITTSIQKIGLIEQVHLKREAEILRAYINKFIK